MQPTKRFRFLLLSLLLFAGLVALFLTLTTHVVSAQDTVPTNTPDSLGKIYYKVQPGDNCSAIAKKVGVTVQDIISFNGLRQDCPIFEGNNLIIAMVSPVVNTPTKVPTATPDPALITPGPTPSGGAATVCIVLFNDLDGNGRRGDGETYLYGGVVGLNDSIGKVSLTGKTIAGDPAKTTPFCFNDVPEGSYNLTMAIPDDFNPTTAMNYPISVKVGDVATVDFGAQEKAPQPITGPVAPAGQKSPLLGILGALMLIAGLGLGYYMWRNRKA
ncbi:MAG: LysM peptidoglycan-binding domain-containing protein [Anaerolineaceae bacterium]|nr:LysM peptidoglycan-binding domain-containing protein [Anaerolineaceae bacterium]